MKLQKVLAGVVVAALALTSAPVGNVYADEGEIPIDEAHFPDESFRSWVSENCDTDGDGSLADWEIMMTTGIDVEREGINTLKGIEYFTALRELYCYNNQLTTLDVSKNTALTDLYCYFNELTTLDVSKNTALEQLDCSSNQLTTLGVSGCTALTDLNCAGNGLTTLGVSGCTALTNLSFYGNQLTALDVSGCTELRELDCRFNRLTDLDLSSNVNLEVFYGEGNQYTEVDVSALTNLKEYDGTLDAERGVLVYTPYDPPEVEPDKTIKVGKKVTFKAKKKVASVEGFVPGEVVSVKTKGKKVIVTGLSAGTVTITAYNKKGKELGSWVVKVE